MALPERRAITRAVGGRDPVPLSGSHFPARSPALRPPEGAVSRPPERVHPHDRVRASRKRRRDSHRLRTLAAADGRPLPQSRSRLYEGALERAFAGLPPCLLYTSPSPRDGL